jgi:hypothetical protein
MFGTTKGQFDGQVNQLVIPDTRQKTELNNTLINEYRINNIFANNRSNAGN